VLEGRDPNAIDPENSLRKKFFSAGSDDVKQTKEQEIINELSYNSFDYVKKNGYLGDNKVWNYGKQNSAIRYRASLGTPRSFEPNHGPVALPSNLSSFIPKETSNTFIKKTLTKKMRMQKLQKWTPREILPSDLNSQVPSQCLRFWEKPSVYHFKNDTSFNLTPAFDPDGRTLSKIKMKSVYDTQWEPRKGGKVFGNIQPPTNYSKYIQKQHNDVQY
jgi:hypothetical protein